MNSWSKIAQAAINSTKKSAKNVKNTPKRVKSYIKSKIKDKSYIEGKAAAKANRDFLQERYTIDPSDKNLQRLMNAQKTYRDTPNGDTMREMLGQYIYENPKKSMATVGGAGLVGYLSGKSSPESEQTSILRKRLLLESLMKQGLTEEEALEYLAQQGM